MTPAATGGDWRASERQWFIIGRWQEYAGEARTNLLRIIAIASFYAIELLNYYGLAIGPVHIAAGVDEPFHAAVTWLAIAWTMVALATLLCLRMHIFPAVLKYATTAADLVLLSTVLMVADGPRSPLLVAYFLVIAASGLRFRRSLAWFATLGSIAGYLAVCGYARWYAGDRLLRVPVYQELIFITALALAGIILGQVVRWVRAMAEDFAAHRLMESGRRLWPAHRRRQTRNALNAAPIFTAGPRCAGCAGRRSRAAPRRNRSRHGGRRSGKSVSRSRCAAVR